MGGGVWDERDVTEVMESQPFTPFQLIYNVVSLRLHLIKLTHISISISLPLEYLNRMETEEAQEMAQMPGKRLPTA